jgi:hypothetical protein
MQITIGRAKRGIGSLLPGQACVGRPSVLGNPFVVGRDGSWRAEVVVLVPPPCRAMRRWCDRRCSGWRGRRGLSGDSVTS